MCLLKPLTHEIDHDTKEIRAAKWMKIVFLISKII